MIEIKPFCQNCLLSSALKPFVPLYEEPSDIRTSENRYVTFDHFPYPIEPKKIPQRDANGHLKAMYSRYQDQTLCDVSIFTKEGILKVHSAPLCEYGGKMVKEMILQQEPTEKEIRFDEFSLKCVKAFIDFVYLGEKGLEPKSVRERDVDVYELLKMAYTYQVQPLIDCCTNLISLSASVNDLEKVKSYADSYKNGHLLELSEFFQLGAGLSRAEVIKV
ncbi:MAG: BTB/POZ domain-containing protein [Chlamydiales bacterium]